MTVTTVPRITFVVSPLPVAGEPTWDAQCREWRLTDSDGISQWVTWHECRHC
jgi:hypothetical protein